jgi:lipid-binding SYLF domain-containing protein
MFWLIVSEFYQTCDDRVMKAFLAFFAVLSMAFAPVASADDAAERLQEAAALFREVMSVPERSIPQDLLERAHCIVLVPGLKKAAFGFGGKYGRGFTLCRREKGGGWGAPGAVRVEGGSVGFQIGVSSTDVVMLVMNQRGMEKLLSSKFTIGADAAAAAGPVGRQTAAQTDAFMRAEILSWSRSRGAFAGVSLEGATLRNDLDVNRELYGQPYENRQIVMQNVAPPKAAAELLKLLNKYSLHEAR